MFAIFVRAVYLYESSDNPTFSVPIVDSLTYDQMARDLAEGKPLTSALFWQPLFYPLFLSAIYRLSNSSILLVKIIQALLGALTCVLVYRLGRKIFDTATGFIAGFIAAFYMPMVFIEGELLAESWAAFWSVVLLLFLLRVREKPGFWSCFGLGLFGALSIITRPVFLFFFTAGCLWLVIVWFWEHTSFKNLIVQIVGIIAGFLVVAGPVGTLSYRVVGKPSIMPLSGGINFYIGNNPNYKDTITVRPGMGWRRLTDIPLKHGIKYEREKEQFFLGETIKYIVNEPAGFLKGLAYKTAQFLNSREIPRNLDIYLFRKWSAMLRAGVWKAHGFGFPFGLLLPLAVAGAVYWWRKVPAPVWLFVIFYPAAVILVFVTSRYRVPFIPVMGVLAAGGCVAVWKLVQQQWKKFTLAAVALFAIALANSITGPFYEEQLDFKPELYYGLGDSLHKHGRLDDSFAAYCKAVTLRPAYVEAHHNLGLLLADMNRLDEAIDHYNTALKIDPENPGLHEDLGRALVKKNRFDEAVSHYHEAIRINPDSASAHDNLGTALFRLGRLSEALEHYSRAIELSPDDSIIQNNIGNVLSIQGQPEKAVEHYEISLRIVPDDPETLNNLANALASLGRFEQAIDRYRQSLKFDSRNAGTHVNLAICLEKFGRIDQALEEYKQALKIDPQHKAALLALERLSR